MKTYIVKTFYSVTLASLSISGCGLRQSDTEFGSESTLMVDLNTEGNAKLKADAERFKTQLAQQTGFLENEKLPRVILQGFGAFQSVSREDNASYMVVKGSLQKFSNGQMQRLQIDGAEVQTGIGVVNGQKVRIFSMINDVNPATAAYIAHSRNIIQPNFTLSSGQASETRVERYSSNTITNRIPSYNRDGQVDTVLSNQGTRVDESRPPDERLSYDAQSDFSNNFMVNYPPNTMISSTLNPTNLATEMGLPVGQENSGGTYICNLAKVTNDIFDRGQSMKLTPDYNIPSTGPTGGSGFVHWEDVRNLKPEERSQEINRRVEKVESAIGFGLGQSNLPKATNTDSIIVNETPSGFPNAGNPFIQPQ